MVSRRAFTLVELLVVVAVIGLLISIVVPSMSKARGSAKRAVCASNLRQVGIALRAYLGSNNDRMPYASYMPSISPFPLEDPNATYIAEVLKHDTSEQDKVFKCPNDVTPNDRPEPNINKTYFESERSSYEYRGALPWGPDGSRRLAGRTVEEYVQAQRAEHADHPEHPITPVSSVWIFRDFTNFHASAGTPGARRYLYIDGRVTDFE